MNIGHRIWARFNRVRGAVDGVYSGKLVGWAYSQDPNQTITTVGLFLNGALLCQAPANIYRGDLEAAGIGDGSHGFELSISQLLLDILIANDQPADVCLIGKTKIKIGEWLPQAAKVQNQLPSTITANCSDLRKRIYFDLCQLNDAVCQAALPKTNLQPLSEKHSKIFGTTDYLHEDTDLTSPMFAYAEFIRLKEKFDTTFKNNISQKDIGAFLHHYVSNYSTLRGGLRVPLSNDALGYLNEPEARADVPSTFSRAIWSYLNPYQRKQAQESTEAADDILFWWAHSKVKALHCEDCLITEEMVKRLGRVPKAYSGQALAPSDFMVRLARKIPAFSKLNLLTPAGRRDLGCAVLLLAMSRPDYLWYVPAQLLHDLLVCDRGQSELQKFCQRMGMKTSELGMQQYTDALRHVGFDLEHMAFNTFTAEGHRLEAPSLPCLPKLIEPVDIQIIGPLNKTSGLGQAARLSVEMLENSGFSTNAVDFNIDNPSPESSAKAGHRAMYQTTKVNLLHLNAETVPLAFAYSPDVFTDAYNIAYVFWELDSPGACHFLGLDMVDEIWVSSDFGVNVFQPHIDVPVTNVGMSFNGLPNIDRGTARETLERMARISREDFAFIVTFDSFSFVQRKNPLGALHAFSKAFPLGVPNNNDVRLIIKTQNRTNIADQGQAKIWSEIDNLISADPRIILIDETLPYQEVLELIKGSDAYLSLHRAEGWGFGIIEAMNLQVPVVCTQYSGNTDFCPAEACWQVQYELKELEQSDYIFVREGQAWAEPDLDDAARQMRSLMADPKEAEHRAKTAFTLIQSEFSKDAIGKRYYARLKTIFDSLNKGKSGAEK